MWRGTHFIHFGALLHEYVHLGSLTTVPFVISVLSLVMLGMASAPWLNFGDMTNLERLLFAVNSPDCFCELEDLHCFHLLLADLNSQIFK